MLRLEYLFWRIGYRVGQWVLDPWLWFGPLESQRVITWYLETFAARCYGLEERLEGRC